MAIRFEGGKLFSNLKQVDNRTKAFIYATCKLHARRGQAYARTNAPWTDRTGNARNGLVGAAFKGSNSFGIIIAGTVSYQIWLEVRWSGRYAIIRPTVEATSQGLMQTLSAGWSRAVGGAI
jgi:hypothetical protein